MNNPSRYTDPSGHVPIEGCGDDGKAHCHASELEKAINAQKLAELLYDPSGQKQKRNREIAETILYDGTEVVASVFFEPADWASTAYHCANGDCSPLALLGLLPFIPSSAGRHADDLVSLVPASSIHFSQEGISWATRKGDELWLPLDDLAQDMAQGWRGDPLDVVTDADGSLVSLDNRRLAAAKLLDISVPIVIRDPASVWQKIANRDGIFDQIRIHGTNLIIDMFGNLR